MRNGLSAPERLSELSQLLPFEFLIDVNSRMKDWIISGGNDNDPYMWRLVDNAEFLIKRKGLTVPD